MNSLENVRNLLKEHLDQASTCETEMQKYILLGISGDYRQRVYDCFYSWITDPTQSPESIIHLLDIYITKLDGFSTNRHIQILVSYPCFEALAKRRPAVLEGAWEKVAWIIIRYSRFANTCLGKGISAFKTMDEATLKWIVEISTPELCPNPCLRLELLRLMRTCFLKMKFDCDRASFRKKVIDTIFEVIENYSSLTLEQIPNFSAADLYFAMKDNNMNIGYIMNDDDLYPMRFDIIIALLKLTRNLALLEKERELGLQNQAIANEIRDKDLPFQLSCCLAFCGLLPTTYLILSNDEEGQVEYNDCLIYFVQAIENDNYLLDIIIHTLDTVTDVAHCFPDEHGLQDSINKGKGRLLKMLFKDQICDFPKYQYQHEMCGGLTPAAEYRIRYFQNNAMDQYIDSEYGSERYDNDSNFGSRNSEESFSEFEVEDE